jgi:hypothetical protein
VLNLSPLATQITLSGLLLAAVVLLFVLLRRSPRRVK